MHLNSMTSNNQSTYVPSQWNNLLFKTIENKWNSTNNLLLIFLRTISTSIDNFECFQLKNNQIRLREMLIPHHHNSFWSFTNCKNRFVAQMNFFYVEVEILFSSDTIFIQQCPVLYHWTQYDCDLRCCQTALVVWLENYLRMVIDLGKLFQMTLSSFEFDEVLCHKNTQTLECCSLTCFQI